MKCTCEIDDPLDSALVSSTQEHFPNDQVYNGEYQRVRDRPARDEVIEHLACDCEAPEASLKF